METSKLRLTYYDMSPEVVAFSTTRHGGVSQGNYASFNVNEYCGDAPEHVADNRLLLAGELGVPADHIIMPHQTHGVETRIVSGEFMGLPSNVRSMLLDGVDAVMTDVPGLCVGVSTADCIPVLLYDAEHHAVCAIHAGWRGTLARIVQKAVMAMGLAYKSDPKRLKAVVGPGISMKNFEVGDEVYAAFEEAAFDMASISEQQIKRNSDATDPSKLFEKKWHINLPLANKQLLLHLGLQDENIHMTDVCTYDHADDYFSARRLGVESGRIYSGIVLR